MELVVRCQRCPPPDQPQAIQARFGAQGGSIGRGSTCTLPLPDHERRISREHLEVRFRDDRFILKVISRHNGAMVNDTALTPGAAIELAHGDRIQVGEYVFVAELREDPLAAFGQKPAGGKSTTLDRLADDMAPPSAPVKPELETSPNWAGPRTRRAATPPRPSLAAMPEPDPTDSLLRILDEKPSPSRPAPSPSRKRSPAGSEGEAMRDIHGFLNELPDPAAPPPPPPLAPSAQGLYRVNEFELPMSSAGADRPAPAGSHSPPAAAKGARDIFDVLDEEFSSTRPMPDEAILPPAAEPPPRPAPAPVPASGPAPKPVPAPPPASGATPGVPAVPSPRSASPEGTLSAHDIVRVLAESLHLEPDALDPARALDTVRLAGELLHSSLGGLYQMLQMRGQMKAQLGIESTMIASRENNPLKHAESAPEAVRYLVDVVQHRNRLFMQPAQAVEDAVSDVCAHELAVMAGTRAALAAALAMFAPATIEKRIKKSGALDAVVPALHKAKLWENFLAMYGELEKEAEDHFDRLLDQEFARAYSDQARKLRRRK